MRKLILVLAFFSLPALAENLTGNELLDMHRKADPNRAPGAFWYMRGVLDADEKYRLLYTIRVEPKDNAFEKLLAPAPFCLPDGVQYGQIYDVYVRYLATQPATRHLAADYLLGRAMHDAWPCPAAAK